MASLKISLFLLLLVYPIFFLSRPALCDDEDNLLQGINSYRQSLSRPALTKNKNADCVADELAEGLDDQSCDAAAVPSQGTLATLANYPKVASKCNININTTTDGVIMPVCVHKLVPTLVLTNYTRTYYAKYLNASKFTGVGVGSKDDWTVVVLTSNTLAGSFASGASKAAEKIVGLGVVVVLGWFIWIV
ncbi:hypothetical protein SLE2022_082430 [Rubroshorea leprosula]